MEELDRKILPFVEMTAIEKKKKLHLCMYFQPNSEKVSVWKLHLESEHKCVLFICWVKEGLGRLGNTSRTNKQENA